MPPKRKIKVREIIADIRSGLTDSELMAKYRLSAYGLHSLFKQLETAGALRPAELYGRHPSYDDTVDLDQVRREMREYLQVPLPIRAVGQPQTECMVSDISMHGVRIKGLRATVGEIKGLVILADYFFQIDPFGFEAVCRWVRREGANRDYVAGFEVTAIHHEDFNMLQELIGRLRLDR